MIDPKGKHGSVEIGATIANVETALGTTGNLEFATLESGSDLRCLEFTYGEDGKRAWFLFENGKLARVVDPRPVFHFETQPSKDGSGSRIVRLPWEPEAQKREFLALTGIKPDDWIAIAAQDHARSNANRSNANEDPALINVLALAPGLIEQVNAMSAAYRAKILQFEVRFDFSKVATGMTPAEVEVNLGPTSFIRSSGKDEEWRAWGPADELRLQPEGSYEPKEHTYISYWLLVRFVKGRATELFSDSMFLASDILKPEWRVP